MVQLNSHYSLDEFEVAFPMGEMITNHIGLSVPRYCRVWHLSDKVMMRISEPRERDEEKDAFTNYVWIMFMKKPELNCYWTLYSSGTSEDVIKCTKHRFNPSSLKPIINQKDSVLDIVEVNIMSALKETDFEAIRAALIKLLDSKKAKANPDKRKEIQDKIDNLQPVHISEVLNKSSCSYIYYSGTSWHAYYPDTITLADFHKRTSTVPNQKYLDFLASDEFTSLRNSWNELIIPGE